MAYVPVPTVLEYKPCLVGPEPGLLGPPKACPCREKVKI
jgi:hypothetical protein